MDEKQVRAFLREIATMPDPEQARELALSNRQLVLSPLAFRVLGEMIHETEREDAGQGLNNALRSLHAFRTEMVHRAVTDRGADDSPLPALTVASDHGRDRFAYWLDRIEGGGPEEQSIAAEDLTAAGGDAVQAAIKVMRLERQHLALLPRTMFGRADGAAIDDLHAILAGYQDVLDAGLTDPRHLSVNDLWRRCAQVYESLGRASDVLGRPKAAREYYEQAGSLYERVGDRQEAEASRERLARLRLDAEADIDLEMQRLHAAIDATPSNTVRRAALLIELAELYQRNGNDFDAVPLLDQAQHVMRDAGFDDPAGPSGRDLAHALTAFASAARSGDLPARAARMQELILVRALYARIYAAWIQIVQGRGDVEAAERYQALAAGLEDPALNAEFSREMSAALPELFGATETGMPDSDFSRRARAALTDLDLYHPEP
jgi:hypothetical protein